MSISAHNCIHTAAFITAYLATLAGAHIARAEKAVDRPNIILAMADDQGYGDVAYNGHPVLKTPVLDEMARTGLRFDRFYAAAPVCSPTRGSVLTGRTPNRFGCFSWGHTLRPEEVTVAEALRTAGYATGHFGKWHLGPMVAGAPNSPGESGFDEWVSSPNFYENNPQFSQNGTVIKTEGESSRVTVDAALDFIRAANKRKTPFLAVVWFGNPHGPHEATAELRALYPDQPERLQNFYGEITGIDQAMGHLRDELRKLGIADNTLIWYTSDNGAIGPGSTGGLRGKKASLYEGGVAVPAIIEWPARISKPRTADLPACTYDIYPTLLDLLDITMTPQPPLDGVSLMPLIHGKQESRAPMGFWAHPAPGRGVKSGAILQEQAQASVNGKSPPAERTAVTYPQHPPEEFPGHAAWIDGGYKLHRLVDKKGEVQYLLYDLLSDRRETKNLVAVEPERTARMKADLEKWLSSVVRSLNGQDYDK